MKGYFKTLDGMDHINERINMEMALNELADYYENRISKALSLQEF